MKASRRLYILKNGRYREVIPLKQYAQEKGIKYNTIRQMKMRGQVKNTIKIYDRVYILI